jgi:hypothetical protein
MRNKITIFFFLSLFLLISCSPADDYIDPSNPYHQLNQFLKEEDAKDKDPLDYEDEIYRNSFKSFISVITGKRDFTFSDCYFDLKDTAVKHTREFIQSYNHLTQSSLMLRDNNFSAEINPDSFCSYTSDKSFKDAAHPSKEYAKNTYVVLKHSFLMLFRSDFFQTFLKYAHCAAKGEKLSNPAKWEQLRQMSTYHRVFESFCSIQSIVNNFRKKVDKYHVFEPFRFMGDRIYDFFEVIQPHLNYMKKN